MQNSHIKTISRNDPDFPQAFSGLAQPITELYAVGNISLLHASPRLGIVGSRKITNYGKEVTTDMARAAARAGVTIVSGLAFGVDSVAHTAALDVGGNTIAVLPCGIQNIYPASHSGLAQRILDNNGLLISEEIPKLQPMKHHFIRRNRLIAALSDTLLVTEAGEKSGSRHTVDFAIEMFKTIATVPGNITSPMSIGTNKLILEGAELVFSTSDLLTILGVNEKLIKPQYSGENEHEKAIIKALSEGKLSTESLAQLSTLEVSIFNTHLTILELKGVVEQLGPNTWRLAK
jgi:DNA processing protein